MLRLLRLTGGMRYDATLRAPWGFEVAEQENLAPFYIVVQGECLIEITGPEADHAQGPRGRLAAGELAMLPLGRQHIVTDTEGSRVVSCG